MTSVTEPPKEVPLAEQEANLSTQESTQTQISVISLPSSLLDGPAANGQQHLASQQPATSSGNSQWVMNVAAQTTNGVRQRMSMASDQLGHSLRQLYASASSITEVPPSYHNLPGIVPYYHGRSSGPPPSYNDVINPYAAPPTYQSLFGQMREARKSSRSLLDLLRRLSIILLSTLGCTILILFMILVPFTMIIVGAVYIDECRIEHIPAFLLVGGLVWASKNILHCYAQCWPADGNDGDRSGSGDLHSSYNFDDLNTTGGTQQQLASSDGMGTLATPTGTGSDYQSDETNNQHRSSSQSTSQQQQQQQLNRDRRRLKSSICESLLNCILFGWFIAGCVIVFRNYEPDFDNPASLRYCHRTVYMYIFWLISSAILLIGLLVTCICCLMVSSAVASRQEDDLA